MAKGKKEDDLDGIEAVTRLAAWGRRFIAVISGLLGIFFAWIQLKEVPFTEFVEKTPPHALTTAALIIYYACWIAGCNFDVRIQEKVYVADPKLGRITLDTILITALFAAVTAVLLYVSSDEKLFSLALFAFIVANIFGWRHIVHRVRPAISSSRKKYDTRKNYFRLIQLNLVEAYMTGRWQMHRFWTMLAIISLIVVLCWAAPARLGLASVLQKFDLNLSPATIASLVPGCSIFLYVLVAEGWIWIKRINVRTALSVLDDLKTDYQLIPAE